MQEDKRPLFTLTVEEFMELNKTIKVDRDYIERPPVKTEVSKPDIIYSDEAAEITNYTKSTLYSKVNRGEIPYLSGGKPLTFSRAQLQDWMHKGRPTVAEIMAEEFNKLKNKKK